MIEPTPVEVWAPAFEQAKTLPERLTVEAIFSSAEDYRVQGRRRCNLCELDVRFSEVAEHARQHQRERAQWRRGRRRSREQEGAARLRQVNRLKKEAQALGRAPGDAGAATASSGGRPRGSATRRESKMATTTTEEKKVEGAKLFDALLARVREAKIGKVVAHKTNAYARVLIDDGERNAGYVVPGKTKLNVYPQAEAKDMPKDLGFKKVKLGSHHFGRGEVIVPVEGEADFDAAIRALQTAAKLPARKRAKAAAKPAEAKSENGSAPKRQAKSDPKPSAAKKAAAAVGKGK